MELFFRLQRRKVIQCGKIMPNILSWKTCTWPFILLLNYGCRGFGFHTCFSFWLRPYSRLFPSKTLLFIFSKILYFLLNLTLLLEKSEVNQSLFLCRYTVCILRMLLEFSFDALNVHDSVSSIGFPYLLFGTL